MRNYLGIMETPNVKTLEKMQVEKGGMMNLYFAPYFPDVNVFNYPGEAPTLKENYFRFQNGGSLYPENGQGMFILELGGIIQVLDDIEDREKDKSRGVISPENIEDPIKSIPSELADRIAEKLENIAIKVKCLNDKEKNLIFNISRTIISTIALFRIERSRKKF